MFQHKRRYDKENLMQDQAAATPPEDVDIEEIMQQIRRQILAKKAALSPTGGLETPTGGKRLPPEFYEQLYQAGLAYDQIGVRLFVTPVKIPIFGRILVQLRAKLHELVLYYVNQLAAEQIKVNTHLLQSLSILSQTLENEAPDADV